MVLVVVVSASESDSFSVSKNILIYEIGAGESVADSLIISSKVRQRFEISLTQGFVSFGESSFELDSGEDKDVEIFIDGGSLDEGVYPGKIEVLGGSDMREIPLIVEVQTPSPIFDVSIESPQSSVARPGESFVFEVGVFKFKGDEDDAILNILLFDLDGGEIFSETQELEVTGQLRITKSIDIPTKGDSFILAVVVEDVNGLSVGTSTEIIGISERDERGASGYIFLLIIIVALLIFVVFIFNHFWAKKLKYNAKHWDRKVQQIKKIKNVSEQVKKLSLQKSLLIEAYGEKYISKASYEEGIEKIEGLLKKVRKRL